jgi:hypothetical protein
MTIDDRTREGLQRSMAAIDVDAEQQLADAWRRGRRRLVARRAAAVVAVAAAIALAAVVGPELRELLRNSDNQPAAPTPSSEAIGRPSDLILGTWRMQYTCAKIVRTLDQAGIGDFAAKDLVGMGIQQRRSASSSDPCKGAKVVERTVIFLSNGRLRRYQGDKVVDDCTCYQLAAGHRFVVPGNHKAPDIVLRYRIVGDVLTFDAVMPDRCSATCRHQFAFALVQYAVGPWQRVHQ